MLAYVYNNILILLRSLINYLGIL